MPIHDFACSACGHEFEELVLGSEGVACPECRTEEVDKQISSFSVGTSAGMRRSVGVSSTPSRACGTCGDPGGPGSCAAD